ncbi:hypothetical protein K1T71_009359 [Dendrolimus kikuchii]|uniref:Uncharacterized protein n=1 Tax=Dendrolimus kikuchii TaxID=765133 RepID=A0ACC1CUB4_9NEOP|nr:hypothetical protein K1T71_009359 [Dendrolimus kikuchii]
MYLYLVLFIVICIIYYFNRKYNYWKDKNVAGPKSLPFFGNLIESSLRRKYIGSVYNEIYREFPNEKIVGIYRMTSPALIIRDLDIVKNILIKDFEVFPYRGIDFSKERLGDNLFHCDSETWRALKNKLTPLFTTVRLKSSISMLSKQANRLADYIEIKLTENNEQDLRHFFEKYTMASIMSFAFGIGVDTMNEDNIFATIDQHCFTTTYWAEADMLVPGIMSMLNKSLYDKTINKFCQEVFQASVELRNNAPAARNDMIDILFDLKNITINENDGRVDQDFRITNHMITSQVFIFFIAGYGNNGSSLSYLMYYLAKYPETQNKLVSELDEILNKYNGELTYEAINEMMYLDKVFNEVLRLHPLTNSIQRCSVMPYTIPGTDIIVDKGTSIVISPYAIHRDENNFPNADLFDPERFSPENSRDRHPCAFLPFGAGPRACLGIRFAKLQFAIGAVKFLSRFRVELSTNTKPIEKYNPMRTLFYPEEGIRLNVFLRNISY